MIQQHLLTTQTAYPNKGYDAALSPSSNNQLMVHSISAYNGSGGTANLGIGHSLNNYSWKLWTITASVAEATSAIQAGTATTILPTTNNYGFIAQASSKFGMLAMVVSQAETGSPTYSYQYWDGSTWQTLTIVSTTVYTSTGKIVLLFHPPIDWAVGAGSLGPDETMYSIRVRGTTAPSTAVKITGLKVCRVIAYRGSIASAQQLQVLFKTRQLLLQQGESIVGYFSAASAGNTMEASYQLSP